MDEPTQVQIISKPPVPINISIPEGATVVDDTQWSTLMQLLKRAKGKKFVLGSLLMDCRARYLENGNLVLVFKNVANKDRLQEELEHPPSRLTCESAVSEALGESYNLKLEAAETDASSGGHLVRAAMALGAKVITNEEHIQ